MAKDTKKELETGVFDPTVPCESRLVTRRQFLARGLITGGTLVTIPTVVHELFRAQPAYAAPNDWVFMQINGSGGPSIHGNFAVTKPDGSFATDITRAGVANSVKSSAGGIDNRFGQPFFGNNVSQIAAGMLSVLSPEAAALVQAAGIVTTSENDTSNNPEFIGEAVARAGRVGQITSLAGSRNSVTGISQQNAILGSATRSLFAGRVEDIQNAANFTSVLNAIPKSGLNAMANGMEKLSQIQMRKLQGLTDAQQIEQLSAQTFSKNKGFVDFTAQLDARQVAAYQQIFNITPATNSGTSDAVIGSLVMGAMNGMLGCVGIDVGGCDYHGQQLNVTEPKDFELGRRIGQCLQAAYVSGKKAIVFLSADGTNFGSDAADGRRWSQADRGSLLTTWELFIMDPSGKHQLLRPIPQIGTLQDNYSTDKADLISGTHKAAAAVALNVISLMNGGDISKFETIFPKLFKPTELDQLLIWNPKL